MKKFEYMVGGLSIDWDLHSEQAQLNEAGNSGWELVCSIVRGGIVYHYFKREMPDSDDNVKTKFPINARQKK